MTQREKFEKWLNILDKQTLVTMAAKQARTIEELQAATKAAAPQWIPVSERLPPVDDQCLFYRPLANKSGDKIIAVKTAIPDGQFCWDNTVPDGETPCNPSNGACHVTHWMPLPAPPEQNK